MISKNNSVFNIKNCLLHKTVIVIFFALFCNFASLAFGDTTPPNKAEQTKQDSLEGEDFVRSSRSYRKIKRAYIALEPIGFILTPAIGLRGSYLFTPDLAIETNLNAGGLFGDSKA